MREIFKQCELTRPLDGGLARMVSWIPERIAIAGAQVRLKDSETGHWTDGWTVLNATGPALPEDVLSRNSRDYRRQRLASDI